MRAREAPAAAAAAAPAIAIAIDGREADRGDRPVLRGLKLSVAAGEVYALLGANGAGKSTTLAALLGFLAPRAGSLAVCGRSPQAEPDAVRRIVAYLPENVALYEHLSAVENVRYFLDLAGERRGADEIDAALAEVRLAADAARQRVGTYSKGMRQKTAIALALLRRAPVLLLDEPTTGLDPGATREFHRLLDALRGRGVAILRVTHDLLGAAELADRIGLLAGGRLTHEWCAAPGPARFDLAALHRGFAESTA
ncbi:MAG: ABC transporter ATP-binding protein [Pseudomonadota bacterium]